MTLRIAILYNRKSNSNSVKKNEIEKLFKKKNLKTEYFSISSEISTLKKSIKDGLFDILVAAGGDGTVNLAASLSVEFDIVLGILPAGTLNHFAKDLDLPLELVEAAEIIINGKTVKVDYATVNNKVFVNNSSIGIYPDTLVKRQKLQAKIGKWPAAVIGSLASLHQFDSHLLSIKSPSGNYRYRTPMLFVGNNSYQFFKKMGFTNRTQINSGKLYLYVIRTNRIANIIRITVNIFFGHKKRAEDYIEHTKGPVIINSKKKFIKLSIDGELVSQPTPLTYKIHSGGLKVRVAG